MLLMRKGKGGPEEGSRVYKAVDEIEYVISSLAIIYYFIISPSPRRMFSLQAAADEHFDDDVRHAEISTGRKELSNGPIAPLPSHPTDEQGPFPGGEVAHTP